MEAGVLTLDDTLSSCTCLRWLAGDCPQPGSRYHAATPDTPSESRTCTRSTLSKTPATSPPRGTQHPARVLRERGLPRQSCWDDTSGMFHRGAETTQTDTWLDEESCHETHSSDTSG